MEETAEHFVWNLYLPCLEDDIGESNDDRVNRIELQADSVRVKHADARIYYLNAV